MQPRIRPCAAHAYNVEMFSRVVWLHTLTLVLGLSVINVPATRTQEGGTIAGHVRLRARVHTRLPSSAYPTRTIGTHTPPPAPEIKNVVVYMKGAPFRGALPAMKAELRQQNETFVPHVVAITRGSTVSFPNDDPFFHNVFSLSSASSFNLGRYPSGQTRTQQFSKAGLVKVYCEIHSHMSASILVLDHPYFAMPDNDGTFVLPDVPPGRYTIVGWHERVGERTASIQVDPGKVISVDLTVPVEDQR